MGPSGHFYSSMGLMTRDIGFPRVDGWSTGPLGSRRHNISTKFSILKRHSTMFLIFSGKFLGT